MQKHNRTGEPLFALVALSITLAPGFGEAADRTGKEVVESVCIECHGPGKDGAPRIGNAYEWVSHAKQGLDKLTQNAITGIRKMPAHGGQATLSDLEMTRAVVYMVSNGNAKDPDRPFATPKRWTGEQIVGEVCGNCHAEGKNGAPKLGDADAWIPQLKPGLDQVLNSAVRGHKGMPARGGMAHLSDVEIKAAVSYMVSHINVQRKP
jgi:cytochrome c5